MIRIKVMEIIFEKISAFEIKPKVTIARWVNAQSMLN